MEKIGLPALIARLFQETLGVGRAEIALARSKITVRLRAARTGLILLVIAAVIALLGLIGLIVGLVLALLPFVGALLAGLIVLGGALLIAAILGWAGARQLSGQTVEETA